MSTCECCGHAVNSHQRDELCSGCEDILSGIRALPPKMQQHVLARGTGARAGEVAHHYGCASSTHSTTLANAAQGLGCSPGRLLMVVAYGQSRHMLNVPEGFARPAHETPQHEAPAPRTQPRPEIQTPPERPVEVEWRQPEPKEPVRMLTDRAEDAPLPRAVEEVNQEEVAMGTTSDVSPEQQAKITERLETLAPTPTAAARHLLAEARQAAHDAGMDYQCAFAELAHLVLTDASLPDMGLVRLAYTFGEAKGRLAALEALA